jgi:2-iminobutanoate/2-iminopropanoate deaminase
VQIKRQMKKIIQIPNAPKPIGPYSQAVLSNNTLYVSGQIPMCPISGELKNSTIEESANQVLTNIKVLVETAEMQMSDVVKCSIFLKSMDDFAAVNAVYETFFNDAPPARETVQVAQLPLDVSVEISCIAIKSE